MINEIASIGDKLELRKIFSISKKSNKEVIYTSQILDIAADGVLNIAMPIEKGKLIPLTIDDKYQMYLFSSKGLYQCNILITNRYKDDKLFILTVQILSELEKFQRREFYRLDCLIDISYHCLSELEKKLTEKFIHNDFTSEEEKAIWNDKLEELEKVSYQGLLTDLSGGGAKFISDMKLDEELIVSMVIDLQIGSITKQLQLQGDVITSIKLPNRIGYYEHRIKFTDILKEERETIIKYIFEEERRLRRREKEKKG